MNPWEYRKSRGELTRAKKKGIKDFAPSAPMTEDKREEARRRNAKIEAGMIPVMPGGSVCRMARQLDALEEDFMGAPWVPVWFMAVHDLSPEPRSTMGVVSDELRRSVERVRDNSREKILAVSEFLLCFPHCDNESHRAALAYLERVRK